MSLPVKLILNLCIWGGIGGTAIGFLLCKIFPAFYSSWFVVIFTGIVLFESFLIFLIERLSRKVSDTRLAHAYMAVTVGKILLAIILLTVYSLTIGENIKAFAVSFILLYLLFLVLESWTFVRLEKHLKENRLNK